MAALSATHVNMISTAIKLSNVNNTSNCMVQVRMAATLPKGKQIVQTDCNAVVTLRRRQQLHVLYIAGNVKKYSHTVQGMAAETLKMALISW